MIELGFKNIAIMGRNDSLERIITIGEEVVANLAQLPQCGKVVGVYAPELACLFMNGATPLGIENSMSSKAEYQGITYECSESIPINIGEH